MTASRSRVIALVIALLAAAACTSLPSTPPPPVERWGFTAPWDARSDASVRTRGALLDAIVTGWIPLDSASGVPFTLYQDTLAVAPPSTMSPATATAGTTLPRPAARRMALVTSFHGSSFHPDPLRVLATHPDSLAHVSTTIAERAARAGYRGLVLDFEGMTPADTAVTRAVVASFARAAHARGIAPVVVALPASDTTAYPARLFDTADLLMVMLYDQHWATSPAGPIASPEWVRRTMATRVAESGASRLVGALPLYGYQWRATGEATTIGYDDARRLAAEAGVALDRDPASSTLHATRSGADGWELWVSDAVLLTRLQAELSALGVRRLAFWRLGLEDPSFWGAARR